MTGMNSHILSLNQHLNQTFHCPILIDRDVQRFASAYRAILSLLVLKGIGIYAISPNQHEVVVQVSSRAGGDLERFVTT